MRAVAILAIPLLAIGCAHTGPAATSSSAPQTNTAGAVDDTQRIEDWRHHHLSAFTDLGTAMSDLGDAMVANDWNAIHIDCAKLTDATHVMRDALPSPSERLNSAFNGLLDNLNAAMIECPALNAESDRIDANTFITNLTRAQDQIGVIKDIMK